MSRVASMRHFPSPSTRMTMPYSALDEARARLCDASTASAGAATAAWITSKSVVSHRPVLTRATRGSDQAAAFFAASTTSSMPPA